MLTLTLTLLLVLYTPLPHTPHVAKRIPSDRFIYLPSCILFFLRFFCSHTHTSHIYRKRTPCFPNHILFFVPK